jgi:hypothetical protein
VVCASPSLLRLLLQIYEKGPYVAGSDLLQGERVALMFKEPDRLSQPIHVGVDRVTGVLLALVVQDVNIDKVSNVLNTLWPVCIVARAGDMV